MTEKLARALGWLGLLAGILTAIFTPLPGWFLQTSVCMIFGYVFSGLYLMLSAKYGIETKWLNPGYAGLLLSSSPILVAIYFSLFT
ncbi:MAG TPA: hypothetical protein VI731_06255 [Bacteroidia bacterium]|nr:hypothetical protein [Bacteroidia bacterium]